VGNVKELLSNLGSQPKMGNGVEKRNRKLSTYAFPAVFISTENGLTGGPSSDESAIRGPDSTFSPSSRQRQLLVFVVVQRGGFLSAKLLVLAPLSRHGTLIGKPSFDLVARVT
jgi:hypothetical protein